MLEESTFRIWFSTRNDIDSIFKLNLTHTCIAAWFIYEVSAYRLRRVLHAKLNKKAQKAKSGCIENGSRKIPGETVHRKVGEKIQAKNKDHLSKILYCKVCISRLEKVALRWVCSTERCHDLRRLRWNANSDVLLRWRLTIATISVTIEGTRLVSDFNSASNF